MAFKRKVFFEVKSWKVFFNILLFMPIYLSLFIYGFQFLLSAFLVRITMLTFSEAEEQFSFWEAVWNMTTVDSTLNVSLVTFLLLNYGLMIYVYLKKSEHKEDLQAYTLQIIRYFLTLQIVSILLLALYNGWYYLTTEYARSFNFHPITVYLMIGIFIIYLLMAKRNVEKTEKFPEE